jgi:hypothetical protein
MPVSSAVKHLHGLTVRRDCRGRRERRTWYLPAGPLGGLGTKLTNSWLPSLARSRSSFAATCSRASRRRCVPRTWRELPDAGHTAHVPSCQQTSRTAGDTVRCAHRFGDLVGAALPHVVACACSSDQSCCRLRRGFLDLYGSWAACLIARPSGGHSTSPSQSTLKHIAVHRHHAHMQLLYCCKQIHVTVSPCGPASPLTQLLLQRDIELGLLPRVQLAEHVVPREGGHLPVRRAVALLLQQALQRGPVSAMDEQHDAE